MKARKISWKNSSWYDGDDVVVVCNVMQASSGFQRFYVMCVWWKVLLILGHWYKKEKLYTHKKQIKIAYIEFKTSRDRERRF